MKFDWLKKVLKFLRRYWLLFAVVLFIVFMIFFDRNNMMIRMEYKHEVDSLKEVIDNYQKRITSDSIAIEELRNTPEAVEKYAREKYGYKRADEDVFVVKFNDDEED